MWRHLSVNVRYSKEWGGVRVHAAPSLSKFKVINMEEKREYTLMCEHFKKVLDAYIDLMTHDDEATSHEKSATAITDYKEEFYRLVNHKNEVL